MKTKDITFIIVTFHSDNVIFDCLNSLPNDSKKIVVENSQNLNLKNILEKEYNNLTCILSNENLGYGRANNIGIKLCETDYVFILNPDVRFKVSDLEKFLEILNKENFVIAAPVAFEEFKQLKNIKQINEVEFVKGFAMLLNKKSLNNIYFDENFFLYLEEIDLCKRIRENNGKILSINVPFIHLGGLSHGDRENIEMEKSRNWHWMWSKFYFKKKYQGYFLAFFSTFPSFLSSIIKFLFYSFTNNKLKKNIYKMRFLGLLNSYFLKKSFYRPKIF